MSKTTKKIERPKYLPLTPMMYDLLLKDFDGDEEALAKHIVDSVENLCVIAENENKTIEQVVIDKWLK